MGYMTRGPYLDNAHFIEGQKKVVHAQKPMHASRRRRQTLPGTRGKRIWHKSGINSVGMKEDKPNGSGTRTRPRASPTCTQPIQGRWALDQWIQGMWFGSEEKRDLFEVPVETSFGKMLC